MLVQDSLNTPMRSPPPSGRRELVEAMRAIAAIGAASEDQIPSIGCSIKWKMGT